MENKKAVAERVGLLTKGCRCITGCLTGRCGCRRKGKKCSEGCECLHCINLPNVNTSGNEDAVIAVALENQANRGDESEFQDFLEDNPECDSDLSFSDYELLSD